MDSLTHLAGFSTLRALLTEFRSKGFGPAELDHGYVGMGRDQLGELLCRDGRLSSLDFGLAFKELEEKELVDTGPKKPIENDPSSSVYFVGFTRSDYKHSFLTRRGYETALDCCSNSFRESLRGIFTPMDIDFFFPEHVTALSPAGEEIAQLRAQIERSGTILIYGDSVPIAPNDLIVRKLANGIEEKSEVLDADYQSAHGTDLPAVTKLHVKKLGSRRSQGSGDTHINVTGLGARVNLHSADNSTNIYKVNSDETFKELLEAIGKLQEGHGKEKLLTATNELHAAVGTGGYGQAFQKFLQAAQVFMPLVTPFLPALAKHLQ